MHRRRYLERSCKGYCWQNKVHELLKDDTIYVMYFQFIYFLPHYDWPGETCWACCPEVTFSGRFGPLCSWLPQSCDNRHSLLNCRVTLAEVLVLFLSASLETGVRMIPKHQLLTLTLAFLRFKKSLLIKTIKKLFRQLNKNLRELGGQAWIPPEQSSSHADVTESCNGNQSKPPGILWASRQY